MKHLSYATHYLTKQSTNHRWVVVDAEGQTLGRLASRIAWLILGKHRPDYTPHVDCGDRVIVLNAAKVRLTGKKWTDKVYQDYSGYPGGLKKASPNELMARQPVRLVERAVRGMLPKNRLGRRLFHNVRVCEGSVHPYEGAQPVSIRLS